MAIETLIFIQLSVFTMLNLMTEDCELNALSGKL